MKWLMILIMKIQSQLIKIFIIPKVIKKEKTFLNLLIIVSQLKRINKKKKNKKKIKILEIKKKIVK